MHSRDSQIMIKTRNATLGAFPAATVLSGRCLPAWLCQIPQQAPWPKLALPAQCWPRALLGLGALGRVQLEFAVPRDKSTN